MEKTDYSFTVSDTIRLDAFLTHHLEAPRNQISQLIKKGAVRIDGVECVKPGIKLKVSQQVDVLLPKEQRSEAHSVDFDVDILYEDDDVLVVDKPSGLTVHDAPSVKEATLVDWLKHHKVSLSTLSGEERHGIVHRLDKGTSGAMVVAKNNEAHRLLTLQLQARTMGRYYLAVIEPPLKESVCVDRPIARSRANRLKMSISEQGRDAKTLFMPLAVSQDEKRQLIACKLFSGRTHQIRVHLESIGRHIVGDMHYCVPKKSEAVERILLHAFEIYFKHPSSNTTVTKRAPLPIEYYDYLYTHFKKESIDAITHKGLVSYFTPDGSH